MFSPSFSADGVIVIASAKPYLRNCWPVVTLMSPPCLWGSLWSVKRAVCLLLPLLVRLLKSKLRLENFGRGLPNPYGLAVCPPPGAHDSMTSIPIGRKKNGTSVTWFLLSVTMENVGHLWGSHFNTFFSCLYFHLFLGKNKLRKWRGWRRCVLTPSSQVPIPHPSGGEVNLPTWEGFSSLGNGGRRKVKSSNTRLQVRFFFFFISHWAFVDIDSVH